MTLQESVRDVEKIAFLRGLRQIRQLSAAPVPADALQDILEVGWFRDSAADEARRILGVPAERLLRTIMSIGFADAAGHSNRTRPAQPRKPLSDIVHHERFS